MFKPRKWQTKAVDRCVSMALGGSDRALVFACPGSGKTYGALLVAIGLRDRAKKGKRVIVLTPNLQIKTQWIARSIDLGLNLVAIEDAATLHAGVEDMFSGGYILTYQQAIHMRASLRLFCDTHKPVAILDEVHHTSGPLGSRDGNAWGITVSYALANASFKLCTTGTPFRQGPNPIAFVDYNDEGRAHAHYEYGYKDAIHDKICRPIQFEYYNGDVGWEDARGVSVMADFSTKLTKSKSRERLRAAISMDGQFPISMINDAHAKLVSIREVTESSDAGGLILAMNIEHAEVIADHVKAMTGIRPVVVHNKIDDSLDQIEAFRSGNAPWIIGVQMLSEGVDIPRLRVGVYCTNIRATLYFHQFCGRVTRVQSSGAERAFVFMPGDPELVATARQIEEEVAHALGEEVPIHEPTGIRRGRGRGNGISVEESSGSLDSSIFSGRVVSADYMRKHDAIIREYAEATPSLRHLPKVELVILLVKAGILPPLEEGVTA